MDRKIISKIVKASGISAGEMILIHFWGEDADKEIANSFMAAVAEAGATPILLQQSRSVNREIFLATKESCFGEQYFDLFTKFDAVLDVFAYRPVILGYEIDHDKFELYRKYMAQLFSKLMSCKRFTQIRIPTAANAEESGLKPQDYIQRMERAYDVDYPAVYEACRQAKDRFEGINQVLLRTGENCELLFELTDRGRGILTPEMVTFHAAKFTLPQWRTKPRVRFILKFSTLTALNTSMFCCISGTGRSAAAASRKSLPFLRNSRRKTELSVSLALA